MPKQPGGEKSRDEIIEANAQQFPTRENLYFIKSRDFVKVLRDCCSLDMGEFQGMCLAFNTCSILATE